LWFVLTCTNQCVVANELMCRLESIGLGQYAENFDAHEVTGEDMPFLQDYQLQEMGVVAVG
jgi:hypothetical protein